MTVVASVVASIVVAFEVWKSVVAALIVVVVLHSVANSSFCVVHGSKTKTSNEYLCKTKIRIFHSFSRNAFIFGRFPKS